MIIIADSSAIAQLNLLSQLFEGIVVPASVMKKSKKQIKNLILFYKFEAKPISKIVPTKKLLTCTNSP
ncbi:hypothetical protein LEP1GSC087_4835 [Leptospira interrogans serovar Bataviae str. L1111]|uniref:Uncharacterized protein n=1 Tax=Leptospira interrogans serovar Zanoni str. LT2156 TaxID=1001601 RepID=M6HSP9_LEPIR|nr:hypothetical protein [Leptospira interrogans]EKR25978.1 hypothetical protein LEP1GSC087_4835 [Leptospira interrogans serovar Bataviae str. L1111]EMM93951.1 hypothetical protein LEP1GSC158_4828 [Leptospira interrogans serovar Zanoni str. LT2156]